jgi:ribosomal protein L12E/L44/L45/RPP1/RPP2
MLRDEWDSMNGIYLGKSLIGISEVLEATEIDLEDRKFITMLVRTIDGVRIQEINNKQKTEKPAK